MTEQTFTVAQVEAALCIWEWMNDRHNQADHTELYALWHKVGTGQMRMLAWELAPGAEALYQSICAELGEDEFRAVVCAYDWEFIPIVCMALDWSEGGQMQAACYQIGPVELPESVRAAVLAEYHEGKTRDDARRAADMERANRLAEYIQRCRRAAGRLWGYPDLVNDDPMSVRDAFDSGRDPEEWAQSEGDDVDLDAPDAWTAKSLAAIYAEPVTP